MISSFGKRPVWDKEHSLSQNILEIRNLKILEPARLVHNFIQDHPSQGSVSYEDINSLQKLIKLLPGDTQKNKEIFYKCSKLLADALIASKKREAITLPSGLLLAYAFSSSVVYGANCISNLVEGEKEDNPYTVAIGISQGIASFTGIVTSLINAPITLNVWYGTSLRTINGQWGFPKNIPLLPSFYSNEEIVKQSHLIALYALLHNQEKLIKDDIFDIITSSKYIEKMRRLTLSHYKKIYKSLARVIEKEKLKNFAVTD